MCSLELTTLLLKTALTINLWMETFAKVFDIIKSRLKVCILYSQFVIFPISYINRNRPNLLLKRYCTYHVFLFIECPIGHFGRNCSNKCSPPNFGYLCGQECPSYCKTCHYIFGCTITTETKGKLYEFKLLWVFCFQRKTYFFFFLAFLIRVCCL